MKRVTILLLGAIILFVSCSSYIKLRIVGVWQAETPVGRVVYEFYQNGTYDTTIYFSEEAAKKAGGLVVKVEYGKWELNGDYMTMKSEELGSRTYKIFFARDNLVLENSPDDQLVLFKGKK